MAELADFKEKYVWLMESNDKKLNSEPSCLIRKKG